MTINSRPSSGEQIIIEATDALVGKKLVGTSALDRFFEDLENNSNAVAGESSSALMTSMMARIIQIEDEITDNPFTIDSTGWTIDTTQITIDMAKA